MPSNPVMVNITTLLLFLFVLSHGVAIAMSFHEGEDGMTSNDLFLMHNSKRVIKTDAGEMRVLKSQGGRILHRRLHIGYITMEPRSLFIPQYLDSNLVIFIHAGDAKLGFIYDNELAERQLKTGDLYVIPAGSPFYFENIGELHRLHIICSIDPSSDLGIDTFQSFYIGGGASSHSVLSGFESVILETTPDESRTEVQKIFRKELDGPIVYVDGSHAPSLWTKFLQLKKEEKEKHLKKMMQDQDQDEEDEEEKKEKKKTSWSWKTFVESAVGKENKKIENKDIAGSPEPYNLHHDKKADFKNSHGWTKALNGDDYPPLKQVDIGVFHVILSAGSMLAPHLNPIAAEYGIGLRGYGRVQIVFPNRSNATNIEIKEGDAFVVPRYFPFCQIASRDEPLELFGFTTSARKNNPMFLTGAVSLIRTMLGPELAAAFGVSEDTMHRAAYAQDEAVILPSPWAAPPRDAGK